MQIGPHHRATDFLGDLKEVMVAVPVNPNKNEAQHVTEEHGQQLEPCSAARLESCETLSFKTMIVMMIASTPSLNASILPLLIGRF